MSRPSLWQRWLQNKEDIIKFYQEHQVLMKSGSVIRSSRSKGGFENIFGLQSRPQIGKSVRMYSTEAAGKDQPQRFVSHTHTKTSATAIVVILGTGAALYSSLNTQSRINKGVVRQLEVFSHVSRTAMGEIDAYIPRDPEKPVRVQASNLASERAVTVMLKKPNHRIQVVSGPPGVGKTHMLGSMVRMVHQAPNAKALSSDFSYLSPGCSIDSMQELACWLQDSLRVLTWYENTWFEIRSWVAQWTSGSGTQLGQIQGEKVEKILFGFQKHLEWKKGGKTHQQVLILDHGERISGAMTARMFEWLKTLQDSGVNVCWVSNDGWVRKSIPTKVLSNVSFVTIDDLSDTDATFFFTDTLDALMQMSENKEKMEATMSVKTKARYAEMAVRTVGGRLADLTTFARMLVDQQMPADELQYRLLGEPFQRTNDCFRKPDEDESSSSSSKISKATSSLKSDRRDHGDKLEFEVAMMLQGLCDFHGVLPLSIASSVLEDLQERSLGKIKGKTTQRESSEDIFNRLIALGFIHIMPSQSERTESLLMTQGFSSRHLCDETIVFRSALVENAVRRWVGEHANETASE